MPTITPFLWFDNNAGEAMRFYAEVFKDAYIGPERPVGDEFMTAEFTICGQKLMVLNGGPTYQLNEAFSLFVEVEDQAEVDYYWNALTADGGEESQCGWLKDKFGLSWQIVPKALGQCLNNPDHKKAKAALDAMLKMKKLIVADLEAAVENA